MVRKKKKLLRILEEDSAPDIELVDDAIAGAKRKGDIVEQHYLRILAYVLEQIIDGNTPSIN
eukprot:15349640-Ditylum_brightwellii.AAC.2